MKPLILLILLTCGAALCFGQKPTATPGTIAERNAKSWQEYASTEGGFSIVFPGTPTHMTQELGSGGGMQAELNIHQLRTFAEYSVMYADYSFPTNSPNIAKIILDNGAQAAVESTKSELLEIKEISIDSFPGRYLKEKMPSGEIMRVKMFLVRQRMYQIAITTPREEGETARNIKFYEDTASKFLDSFKLINLAELTIKELDKAENSFIQKAKDTYPGIKSRYLKGLPKQNTLFISTVLRDKQGHTNRVVIAVKEIKNGIIKGIISSDVMFISGYKHGDIYSFPESELTDWIIRKPDGSEEGNFGKRYLDSRKPS